MLLREFLKRRGEDRTEKEKRATVAATFHSLLPEFSVCYALSTAMAHPQMGDWLEQGLLAEKRPRPGKTPASGRRDVIEAARGERMSTKQDTPVTHCLSVIITHEVITCVCHGSCFWISLTMEEDDSWTSLKYLAHQNFTAYHIFQNSNCLTWLWFGVDELLLSKAK